ncbi:MAG: FtsW/RodA/SpoVE family cell cycle protein [Porphyromonas sp.]|nr:FtsW/RodA/SpoVE family cell cycle protein [Porphyromonas sp.]
MLEGENNLLTAEDQADPHRERQIGLGKRTITISKLFVGDKALWAAIFLLMLTSIVVVFSATSSMAFRAENRGHSFFSVYGTHLMHMTLGLASMIIVSHIPTKILRQYALPFLVFAIGLLVYVLVAGTSIQGAKRYIRVLGISLQPSEIARFALINYVAMTLRKKDGDYATTKTLLRITIASAIVLVLVGLNNNSTAMLIAITIYMICIMGGANRKWLFRATLLGIAFVVLFFSVISFIPQVREIGRVGTLVSRIERFKAQSGGQPINSITFPDPSGEDRQLIASQKAIANSQLRGVGPGNSELREILPEAYSDFIFCIIWEEYGVAGAFIVVSIYIFLFFTIGKIARRTQSVYKSLLILGIAIIITLQAILHMMVSTNLFPITGQNLPFISRGGTSYIMTAAYFGVVLAVSNENKREERQRAARASGMEVEVVPEYIPEFDE